MLLNLCPGNFGVQKCPFSTVLKVGSIPAYLRSGSGLSLPTPALPSILCHPGQVSCALLVSAMEWLAVHWAKFSSYNVSVPVLHWDSWHCPGPCCALLPGHPRSGEVIHLSKIFPFSTKISSTGSYFILTLLVSKYKNYPALVPR